MPVNIRMSMLCLAGIALNIRFFVASCGKRHRRATYWVRLHADSSDETIPEERENKQTVDRAA
jgi:hypothetical protein